MPILSEEAETLPLLHSMELDRKALIDVVRYADQERSFCTSNDIRGFDLITVNAKAARGLRDTFCGPRWMKDEADNQPGILNPFLKLRIVPCNFDHHAGDWRVEPTNKVLKGSASGSKARCNATGWLPNLPDVPAQEGEAVTTWVLGIYSKADEPLKAELSLPMSFSGGRYTRFATRIILLTGLEGFGPLGARIAPADNGPVEIVDIAVRRK